MSSRSYILQIMLWHQSLKSIHYRTLLIFQNKKNPTDLRVKTWGGLKTCHPPMSKHGGDISPPSPQDLRPCTSPSNPNHIQFKWSNVWRVCNDV